MELLNAFIPLGLIAPLDLFQVHMDIFTAINTDAFSLYPPAAPHFGGVWERQIHSIRCALCAMLGAHQVPEKVIFTVLTEGDGIFKSNHLWKRGQDSTLTLHSIWRGKGQSSAWPKNL